jgi:hypothetical protein
VNVVLITIDRQQPEQIFLKRSMTTCQRLDGHYSQIVPPPVTIHPSVHWLGKSVTITEIHCVFERIWVNAADCQRYIHLRHHSVGESAIRVLLRPADSNSHRVQATCALNPNTHW